MNSTIWIVSAGLLLAGCSRQEQTPPPKVTNAPAAGNPLTAPVDYLGAVAKAKKHSESTLDVISINQAIQLFSSEEGRYPKDLNELVTQKYLPRLPGAPAGQKYSYNPATGQVKLVPQ